MNNKISIWLQISLMSFSLAKKITYYWFLIALRRMQQLTPGFQRKSYLQLMKCQSYFSIWTSLRTLWKQLRIMSTKNFHKIPPLNWMGQDWLLCRRISLTFNQLTLMPMFGSWSGSMRLRVINRCEFSLMTLSNTQIN